MEIQILIFSFFNLKWETFREDGFLMILLIKVINKSHQMGQIVLSYWEGKMEREALLWKDTLTWWVSILQMKLYATLILVVTSRFFMFNSWQLQYLRVSASIVSIVETHTHTHIVHRLIETRKHACCAYAPLCSSISPTSGNHMSHTQHMFSHNRRPILFFAFNYFLCKTTFWVIFTLWILISTFL